MFISKGCLTAILENLTVLNKEVDELKVAARQKQGKNLTATKPTSVLATWNVRRSMMSTWRHG